MESPRTKIWTISLAEAAERRARFAQSGPPAELDWSFFDASSGLPNDLHYDARRATSDYGRALHKGELGCYASHVALWRWLIASPYEQMLVLEDDVVVDWAFVSALVGMRLHQANLHYLRLFAKMPAPFRMVASPYLDTYHHLIRFTGYALGTQAYVLTRAGASRLLRNATRVLAPIDVYMDRTWEHGVPNLALYPFPVYERYTPSSIGEQRFAPKQPHLSRAALPSLPRKISRKAHLLWSIYGPEPRAVSALRKRATAEATP